MVVYSYMFHPITACRLDAPQQHMHQQTRKHLRKTLLYLSFLCSCSVFRFFNFPLSSRTVRNDGKNRKMDELRGKLEESKKQKIEEKKGEGRIILILSTSAVNSSVLLFFMWRIIITSLIIASIDFMKLYNRCNVMVIDYPAKIWQHNQNCTSFL